ncbi:hypothetical protein FH063_002850 [Azospirillum argentinense]|uniref:Uncharacterized protein n=1 Tax=Azospirillum argentinense TaxID=2970906 RepID=A0A5B0KMQ9_9PROT|nr:hypothetical protein FH063_002850 [Azospirillum argentinense]
MVVVAYAFSAPKETLSKSVGEHTVAEALSRHLFCYLESLIPSFALTAS